MRQTIESIVPIPIVRRASIARAVGGSGRERRCHAPCQVRTTEVSRHRDSMFTRFVHPWLQGCGPRAASQPRLRRAYPAGRAHRHAEPLGAARPPRRRASRARPCRACGRHVRRIDESVRPSVLGGHDGGDRCEARHAAAAHRAICADGGCAGRGVDGWGRRGGGGGGGGLGWAR